MAERPSAGRRPLSLLGLAELVGGRVVPGSTSPNDPPLHDVAFDSRAPMGPGTLFVAVRGDRSDGHDFVAAAVDAGAVAVMVEHLIEGIAVPQMVVTGALRWGRPPRRSSVTPAPSWRWSG